MRRMIRHQAGDTIIEVLISIAIISSILGIAFATSNRSLRAGRQAQERTEATKIAESQIEKIKGYLAQNAASGSNLLPNDRYLYCLQPTRSDPYLVGGDTLGAHAYPLPGAFSPNPPSGMPSGPAFTVAFQDIDSLEPPRVTTFPAECQAGPDGRYRVAVANNQGVVTVVVRWDQFGGGVRQQVILVYKINED